MSDADETVEFAGDAPGRDYGAAALVVACVVAAVLATALVPAATAVGVGDSPAESLIPIPGGEDAQSSGSEDAAATPQVGPGAGSAR